MAIAVINIERKRGDTKRLTFTVKDAAGAVVDISAWTSFLLTIDPAKNPTDNSNNLGQLTGSFTTDGTDGKVYFVPTGTIADGNYFYDAQALDSAGEKCTFVEGKYKLTQDITKD
jgi:hypothetical protein